jgi:hypothetical protein
MTNKETQTTQTKSNSDLAGMPPEKIYLQWDGDNDEPDRELPYEKRGEISWCQEKVFPLDVEYVRTTPTKANEELAREAARDLAHSDLNDYAPIVLKAIQSATAPLEEKIKELDNELFGSRDALIQTRLLYADISSDAIAAMNGDQVERDCNLVNQAKALRVERDAADKVIENLRARLEKAEAENAELAKEVRQNELTDEIILGLKEQLKKSEGEKAAIFDNCKVVYWPKDGSYPLEHNKAQNKIMSEDILNALNITPSRLISPDHPVLKEMEEELLKLNGAADAELRSCIFNTPHKTNEEAYWRSLKRQSQSALSAFAKLREVK